MSQPFPMVPLSDILTKSDEWIDIEPDERYRQVTVRLWGNGVVQRNEVTGAEIAAARRRIVHSRQFVLSRIDARHGAFGIVPDSLDGAVVSNDFPVFTPVPNTTTTVVKIGEHDQPKSSHFTHFGQINADREPTSTASLISRLGRP